MIRIPQFRGAQVGAAVVVLVTFALLCEVRMRWGPGGHLALTGAILALVATLVVATPADDDIEQPWLAALCLGGLALLAVALGRAGQVLGADGFYSSAATTTAATAIVAAVAWWCAWRRRAAASALVMGVAGTIAVLAVVDLLGDTSVGLRRWLLLVSIAVLALASLSQRDRRPQHGAQLANAGGFAAAGIGTLSLTADEPNPIALLGGAQGVSAGWELVLLAVGFGLLAYGAVDRLRGPVVVGLLDLGLFVAGAAVADRSFVGWPLALLVIGLGFLAFGLRPTTPAPPEPRSSVAPEAPASLG